LDVELVALDDRLVFSTRGGLWTSDGTPGGTVLVKALPFYPNGIKSVRGGVYFSDGRGQLWKSHLTEAGTTLLRDIPRASSSPISRLPRSPTPAIPCSSAPSTP